jgi:hypothetical protein
MAHNLYTATETLLRAYRAIIDEHDVSTISLHLGNKDIDIKTGIPDRMEFYRQQFASRDLTVAERLLSYIRQGGDVFATKKTDKKIVDEQEVKDQAAADYILNSVIENLPPLDPASVELSDEEKQETLNELEASIRTLDDSLPDISNPFVDDNSHNQNPLEPNKDNPE